MSRRNILIFFVTAFLVGLGGGWITYTAFKPSDSERVQSQIAHAVSADLCERINKDIEHFKDSPHTFQRTSLNVLVSESRATVAPLLQSLPFRNPGTVASPASQLLSTCLKEARQWINIPSAFPERFDDELAAVGLTASPNRSLPAIAPNQQSHRTDLRVALVMGNSAYRSRPLKNPANDAKDIATVLRAADFTVLEVYNADLPTMRAKFDEFYRLLAGFDTALVYYSGHGIEYGGRNYFLPVNADIKIEEEIPRQGFDAMELSEKIIRNNVKTSILIIDACRNTPVFTKYRGKGSGSRTDGLTAMEPASGSIVAFSAAPGQIASDGNTRNSPYTAALLKEIQIPGRKIEDVLKATRKTVSEVTSGRQVPWYNSSLIGDFYFFRP